MKVIPLMKHKIFINIPVSTFYLSVGPGVDEGADK